VRCCVAEAADRFGLSPQIRDGVVDGQAKPLRGRPVSSTRSPPVRAERYDTSAPLSACGEFFDQRLHGGEVVGNGLSTFLAVEEVGEVRR
jgi:hypothetical protein